MQTLPSEFQEESAMLMHRRHFKAAMQSILDKRGADTRILPPVCSESGAGTICIYGLLMPSVPKFYKDWGFDATGYDDIAAQAAALKDDPSCLSVILHVDSGGGYVKGIDGAAAALAALAATKPVYAVVDGMSASAAYWLTSKATTIQASPVSEIGGIGVYSTIYDTTEMMKQWGVKPVVIRSAPNKGMGEDEITPDQIAAQQAIVDGIHGMFVAAVAEGRGVSEELIQSVATGQTYLAQDALKSRLIDSITNAPTAGVITPTMEGSTMKHPKAETETPVVEPLTPDPANTPPDDGGEAAPIETPAPGPTPEEAEASRIDGILEAFSDDITFARTAIAGKLTVEQAKAAHYDTLKGRLSGSADGTAPVPPSQAMDANAPRSWDDAYRILRAQGMTDVQAAASVTERFPHLRG